MLVKCIPNILKCITIIYHILHLLPQVMCIQIQRGDNILTENRGDKSIQAVTTYFTGETPKFKLDCYESNREAVITFNGAHVLTWKEFDCLNKNEIKDLYIYRESGDENSAAEVIVGRKIRKEDAEERETVKTAPQEQQLKKNAQWCWYFIVHTENKAYLSLYFGKHPDLTTFVPRRWYLLEPYKTCPMVKEAYIIVKRRTDLFPTERILIRTYMGILGHANVILKCYESKKTKKYYTEIISLEDNSIVEITDLDCSSRSFLDIFSIFYFKSDGESFLALATPDSSKNWCRYDICVSCVGRRVLRNIDDKQPEANVKWSEPGVAISSHTSFSRKFVALGVDGTQLNENDLKQVFWKDFSLNFLLRCYKVGNNYISVVTSPRQIQFGYVEGINCLERQFNKVYVHITRGSNRIYSGFLGRTLKESDDNVCWYYGCNFPKSTPEEITIFYFYGPDKTTNQNRLGKTVSWVKRKFGIQTENIREKCKNGWCVVEQKETGKNKVTTNEGFIKKDEIRFRDITVEGNWILIAKYKQEGIPEFELLCLKSEDTFHSKIIDSKGKHVVTISNHDCSPKKTNPYRPMYSINIAIDKYDKDKGDDYVFVESGEQWYSVCRSQQSIKLLYAYVPGRAYEWIQVPFMEGCPLKQESITTDESKIVVTEDSRVEIYLSDDGMYGLHCHRSGDSEYVSVIRKLGSPLVSVKGLDCSSVDKLHFLIYISCLEGSNGETLTVGTALAETIIGTNPKPMTLETPWCLYDVVRNKRRQDKTIPVNPALYTDEKKRFKWYQGLTDECPLKRENIYVDEKQITATEYLIARYLSFDTGSSALYTLLCYRKDALEYIWVVTYSGSHIITIKGPDCSSAHKANEFLNIGLSTGMLTVGTTLHKVDYNMELKTLWCMYEVQRKSSDAIIKLTSNTFVKNMNWIQISGNNPIKRNEIHFDESNIAISEDDLVARYLSDGVYILFCYATGDGHDFISVIKMLKSNKLSHMVSIKGFKCATSETLNSIYYMTIDSNKKKLIEFVFEDYSHEFWWRYKVYLTLGTVSVELIETFDKKRYPLEWSEAGTQVNKDMSESTLFGISSSVSLLAVYKTSYYNTLVLECYKDGLHYYVKLRGSRDLYIAALLYPLDCSDQKNLMTNAYIHVMTTKEKQILSMDIWGWYEYDNIKKLLQDIATETDRPDIWFYYLRPDYSYQGSRRMCYWEPVKDCLEIRRNQGISRSTKVDTKSHTELIEYYNGKLPQFKLTCPSDENHAVLQSTLDSFEIKLENFDCKSVDKTDHMLHVEEYGHSSIIVGSRKRLTGIWCQYIIPRKDNKDIVQIHDTDYKPGLLSSRWYKSDEGECSTIARVNIVTSPDFAEYESSKLISAYTMDVKESSSISETFVLYCYRTTDGTNVLIHKKVDEEINKRDTEFSKYKLGKNLKIILLASIKGFDCSSDAKTPMKEKLYMFTFRDESMTFLALGSLSSEKKWCQYDVCVNNCPDQNKILLKAGHESSTRQFEWSKPGVFINKIPSLKDQKLIEDSKSLKDQELVVNRYLKRTANHFTRSPRAVKGYFVLECYKFGTTDHTVLRTNKGLIITTIEDINCYEESNFPTELSYIVVKKNDGGKALVELDFDSPPEPTYDYCWFYGCKTTDSEMVLFMKETPTTSWLPASLVQGSCARVDNTLSKYDEFKKNGYELVAKYKYQHKYSNIRYTLECYLRGPGGDNVFYDHFALRIWDDGEINHIATITSIPCASVNSIYSVFDIDTEQDKGNEVHLIIFDIDTNIFCGDYSLIVCQNCAENNWRFYKPHIVPRDALSQWTMVPTQSCFEFRDTNIHLNEKTVDLEGFTMVKNYINKGTNDKATFVLSCFESAAGNSFIQLSTLAGQHVVTVTSLGCVSHEALNEIDLFSKINKFHASVETVDGKVSLAFITPATKKVRNGFWCQYDVCIDCENKQVSVGTAGFRGEFSSRTMIWSANGKDLDLNSQTTSAELPEAKMFSKHLNIANEEYKMECHLVESPSEGRFLTIMDGPRGRLFSDLSSRCTLATKLAYLLTVYEDDTYNLFRFDQKQQLDDEEKRSIKKKSLYIFDQELLANQMNWKLVNCLVN